MSFEIKQLVEKINILKKQKNAVILAHNYQRPEIFQVADFIGDSLELSKKAMNVNSEVILFSGVLFMAQTAKILNPKKKVIVPFLDAGCPLAEMIDVKQLKDFKKLHPKAKVVCYVNTTAEIKAECDVCCTSSNAIKIVKSLKEKEIIFLPDKNLGNYIQLNVPEKNIISWQGFCPVHDSLTLEYVKYIKQTHPKAKIIAHPECRPDVLQIADHVSSTSGMIDAARNDKANDFFVLTECGMTERLKLELPNKNFYGLCNACFDMKKNTLDSIYYALVTEKHEVVISPKIITKAKKSLVNMFDLMKSNE